MNLSPEPSFSLFPENSGIAESSSFVGNTPQIGIIDQNQLNVLFNTLRRQIHQRTNETKQKYLEELRNIKKKYKQAKEQIRIQQELSNNRQNSEKFLQEQLNKATIELTQLRLVRDDLNSSLKQSTAQIQYLNKELEKIRELTENDDIGKNKEILKLQEQLDYSQQQLEHIRNQYQFKNDQLMKDKEILIKKLEESRQELEDLQDQTFNVFNASQVIESQQEASKVEFIRLQQKFAELQMKYNRATEQNSELRQENEHIKGIILQMKEEIDNHSKIIEKQQIEGTQNEKKLQSMSSHLQTVTEANRNTLLELEETRSANTFLMQQLETVNRTKDKQIQLISKDIDIYSKQVFQLKQEIDSIKSDNEKCLNEKSELENQLKAEQKYKKRFENENGLLKKEIMKINSLLQASEEEQKHLINRIESLNGEISSKNDSLQIMASQYQRVIAEKAEESNKIDELTEKIASYEFSKEHDNLSERNMREYVQSLEKEEISLKGKISVFESSHEKILLKLDEMERENNQLVSENNELRNSLMIQSEKMEDHVNERTQNMNEIHKLKKDFESMYSDHSTLMVSYAKLENENKNLYSQLFNKKDFIEKLRKENENLHNQIEISVLELDKLKTKSLSLQNENHSLRNSIDTHEKSKTETQNIADANKREIENIRTSLLRCQAKFEKEQEKKEKLENQMKDYESTLKSLKGELDASININNDSFIELRKSQNCCDDLKAQLDQCKTLLNKMQQQQKDKSIKYNHIIQDNSVMKEMIIKLEETNENQKQEIEKYKRQIKEFEEEFKFLKTKESLAPNENNVMSESSSSLISNEIIQSQLEQKSKTILDLHNTISDLQTSIAELKHKENDNNFSLFQLEQSIIEIGAEKEALEIQNQDLISQLSHKDTLIEKMKFDVSKIGKEMIAQKSQFNEVLLQNNEMMKATVQDILNVSSVGNEKQKERIQELETNSLKMVDIISEKDKQVASLESRIDTFQIELESISKQKEELLNQNQRIRNDLLDHIKMMKKAKSDASASKQQLDIVLQKLNRVEEELHSYQSMKMDSTSRSELDAMKATLKNTESQMNDLMEQNDILQKELKSKSIRLTECEKQSQYVLSSFQNIRKLINTQCTEVSPDSTKFLTELSTLKQFIDASSSEISSLIKSKEILQEEMINLKKTIIDSSNSQRNLEKSLITMNAKYQAVIEERTIIKKENEQFQIERKNLTDSIDTLRQALASLKAKFENTIVL